jgi:hypothetical protein
MQDCYIFLTKIEIGKDSIYKVTEISIKNDDSNETHISRLRL